MVDQVFQSGDLAGARERASAALHDAGEQTVWGAVYRVELARIALYQGRSSEVLPLLREPVPQTAPMSARVRWHTVRSLALDRTGDAESAERELVEEERESPAVSEALLGEIASARGSLNLDQGDFAGAERMFSAALRDARASGDRFGEAQALSNLGVVALQQEHDEEALDTLGQARVVAETIGARLQLEKIIGTVGDVLYDFGDFAAAQQNFDDAEKKAETLGAPSDRVRLLISEGQSAFRQGDRDHALRAFQTSLREAELIGMQEGISDGHANLALLLLDSDPGAAAIHIRETLRIAVLRRHRPDQRYAELLEGMLWSRTGRLTDAGNRLAALERDRTLLPSLHWQTQQELARVSLRTGDDRAAERWFRRAIETFHQQQLSLKDVESTLPFLENGTDLYSDYVQYLVSRGRTEEALAVVDQSRAEALFHNVAGRSEQHAVDAAKVSGAVTRRHLAARLDGAILVYYVLPHESYLWVTTAERTAFFRLPGAAALTPLIEAHRRAILAAKDLLAPQGDPAGRELFQALVGPANPFLRRGGRVFLVGDGPLDELNFDTLVNSEGTPHFWIEDAVITDVPALHLLPVPRATDAGDSQPRRMLLLGDPHYRAGEYQALPKAAEEVKDVMQHFAPESRTVLTGDLATPAAFRMQPLDRFAYIHFVAHSTANSSKPLDSSVVLSADGDGADKLYARDIVGHPLQAELVTISGCNSSGSRVYAGEGPVGLAWAFERAGARNVIGTLWEVNDASTPALMDRMYGRLLAGDPPDRALREAKLSLLHSSGVFRKALYWAPFQLYSSS